MNLEFFHLKIDATLLKNSNNVVYLEISSVENGFNPSDFELYILNQNDTTFLKSSIGEFRAKDPVLRYEVSRDSVFADISIYLEVLPNASKCQLNGKNIQLLIENL